MKKMSKDLIALFWTQFFGALNDNIFKNSLIILITYQSIQMMGMNSNTLVAMAGGIFILPFFFLSATSGQIADRYEKTRLVVLIKKFEIIIAMLAISGLFFKNFPLLMFTLFLFGIHSTFFGPIKYSLIPHYANAENLVFSNALISSGTFLAILIGTILGGIAASDFSNLWFLKLLLLGFAILGLISSRLMTPVSVDVFHERAGEEIDWNFSRASLSIIKLVFKNPYISILIIGLSWFWFIGAGLLSLLPILSRDIFHGNEHVATLMLFVFTIGMGLGPFILEQLTRGKVIRSLIPLSLLIMCFFIFDIAFVINKLTNQTDLMGIIATVKGTIGIGDFFQLNMSKRVLFDLFFLAFFGGIFTVPQFAELQRISIRGELSRIVAGNNIINSLAMVTVSILLMFLHLKQFPLSFIFGILGFLNLVMCIYLIFFYRVEFNKFWRF